MVKIKRKVKKNLPQLIEWGFNNPKEVESKVFESDNIDYFWNTANVQFSNDGCGVRMSSSVSVDDLFTVEVEEEVTEDTKLDGLVELGDDGAGEDFFFSRGLSINDCKDECTQALYILNDDLTMTLIWRDGKLVE
ncbi:hypothetical protein [Staphylococcus nepalensis]|uniref:hypothetical protein n=1 Tax=Staphylococcus nepalensis TaxID=214473 RepID=UPI000E06BC80|nr:hypothetical protein [Staphylococcus nepalensis]SUM69846.1 PVL orf 52-like protein [Staphylococcus nepalensis]SUM96076.1 PVL orf 52-like protein [Staphylococcus nepalensis]